MPGNGDIKIKRFVNTIFNSNSYLVYEQGSTEAIMIDIGDMDPIKEELKKKGLSVTKLFLTHTHYDHIYGINKLINSYPECTIYTSESGVVALADERRNLSKYSNYPIKYEGKNIYVIKENDKVPISPKIAVQVLETPGHNISCLSYIIKDNLFSGDSYIPGVPTISSFPGSDKNDAKASELRLIKLSESKNIFPGHGDCIKRYKS